MKNEINYTRKCIATNQIVPINQLVRFDFVRSTNTVTLDLQKDKKGRGAYFIPATKNWELICKSRALNRTFKANISKETYEELFKQLQEVLHEQEK
ncbi:YlxR family protein [Mycoplasma nasistruthionis]|uniref:YlxR family protein n=1 Tax=Mycoplasma nasistruthionis TaxID=353852 RepID=A0A5B7XUC7_9MOLU|nr:YlxR family protein [Mycoplasma nasistruthionis]QCZ36446.1 YlxR family protein [Mycoplasma nasistruthionis]